MQVKPVIMENKKVSVIVPLYNAEAYLEEAISSVLKQDYEPLELIIVDDGSSDGSLEVALRYESEKVRVFSQKNSGACVARNRGLREAEGEYVKFLDADDVLAPGSIRKQVDQMANMSGRQIPFGRYGYCDSFGNVTSDYNFPKYFFDELKDDPVFFFYNHWEVLITCPLHKKLYLEEIGGFDESLKRGQESDLHFRLALSGVEFLYSDLPTFLYRSHDSESKITNKCNAGTINMRNYWLYRNEKCEKLLKEKFGIIPEKYHDSLSRFWFSCAREEFAGRDKESGLVYLKKCLDYGSGDRFRKFYIKIGRIVGYCFIESIFQFRLKLLKK